MQARFSKKSNFFLISPNSVLNKYQITPRHFLRRRWITRLQMFCNRSIKPYRLGDILVRYPEKITNSLTDCEKIHIFTVESSVSS